jgi:hypothetical protein
VKQTIRLQRGLSLFATIAVFSLPACTGVETPDDQQLVAACTRINHDYALARDHANKEEYAKLFTDDAEFVMQGETFTGNGQIVDRLNGDNSRNFARLLITTVDISPINATTATGVTYFVMYMAIDAANPTPPITKFMVFMGEYHDNYTLTTDGCKFSRRETRPLFTGVVDQ